MRRYPLPDPWSAVLATALFILTALSGCLAATTGDDNRKPDAKLSVNKPSGFNGEEFEFDATGSKDPDGKIAKWKFDFGDGATQEVTESDKAKVRHKYVRGGEYTVTVTVTDDGATNVGQQTDTAETKVKVNEKRPLSTAVLFAAPANQAGTAQTNQTFTAVQGVDRYELNLTVRSALAAGSTEVRIRVLDPDGKTVGEKTETVPATETREIKLESAITRVGDYTVTISAVSGGANLSGEVRVYYDK